MAASPCCPGLLPNTRRDECLHHYATSRGLLLWADPLLGFAPEESTPPQLAPHPQVVLGEVSGGKRAAVGAFVMPNQPIDPDTPLASFAVPISSLEEVAGGRAGMVGIMWACSQKTGLPAALEAARS